MTRAADLPPADRIALLSGGDFWHTRALPDHGVPAVLLSDGPHGLRTQEEGGDHLGLGDSRPATCFPPAVTLASSWDEDLVGEVGRALGAEAAGLGVAVLLGPGLNIKRHPRCGRNFEYFSEDPLLSGRLAAAMVRGIQDTGVGACLKHFAVNNQETMRFVVDAIVDERTLRELYLSGFEHAVRTAQPRSVMAAYNLVNGVYCSDNRWLLTDVLREEWGFTGVVVSDWGAVNDRTAGVFAGMDLEMPGSAGISDGDVAAAVADGRLAAADVTRCAGRILDLVAAAPPAPAGVPSFADHDALARRAAAAGTVLLTNDGTLPLAENVSVALIGGFADQPRYQGAGSSQVVPTRLHTALAEFRDRGWDVRYSPGFDPVTSARDDSAVAAAVAEARAADVAVIMAGLPGVSESEGFDRDDLALPSQQQVLIDAVCRANPRTVVVLSNGAPVTMPWAAAPAAVVEAYLGGQAGGAAVVDVLTGSAEPGGRLAETFPVCAEDVSSDPWFPGDPHQVTYREGLFVGYRHTTTAGVEPLFPFGHGLSFTTFVWSSPTVADAVIPAGGDVTVALSVSNVGDRSGSDVVQVYLHDRTGTVLRPRRELAAFAKVSLQPGETQDVTLTVPGRAFAFWDVRTGTWEVPAGPFDIEVARSSEDVHASLSVTVTGGVTSSADPAGGPAIADTDGRFAARLGYPIPRPRPTRPFTRLATVGEIATTRLGRGIRTVLRKNSGADFAAVAETDPALGRMLERGLDELPLRTAALFSQGLVTWPVLDGVIALLNGDPRGALAVPRALLDRLRRSLG